MGRKNANFIGELSSSNGFISNSDEISNILIGYFRTFFNLGHIMNSNYVSDDVGYTLPSYMQDKFISPITSEKIKKVIWEAKKKWPISLMGSHLSFSNPLGIL